MARIPEFQSQRFASSQVGTPGEDRSGQIIGNAVTKAAGQVEDAAFKAAVQRKEARVLAAANKASIDLDVAFDAVDRQHREKFADTSLSPEETNAEYRASAELAFKGILDSIPDEQTRAHVSKYGYSSLQQRMKSESTRADLQQASFAYTKADQATTALAQRAAEVALSDMDERGKALALQALLNRGSTTHQIARKIVSPENAAKLEKVIPSTIAKGYLDALVDNDPAAVKAALKRVGHFLEPDEAEKYRKDAITSFGLLKERKDTEHLMDTLGQNGELFQKHMDGTLRYGDTRDMVDKRAGKALEALRLKSNKVDPIKSFTTEMAFNDEIYSMVKDEGTKTAKLREKASLEKAIDLQNRILESVQDDLTPAQAESLLNKLRVPVTKRIGNQSEWFDNFKNSSEPFRAAYSFIRAEGKKAKIPDTIQSFMLGSFESRLKKLGPTPTGEQLSDAAKQAWFDGLYRGNPNYGKYQLKDVLNIGGAAYTVVGYYPDGEPNLVPVEKTK